MHRIHFSYVKFEVFPIDLASSDEDQFSATRVGPSARGRNHDSKQVLKPSSYQKTSAVRQRAGSDEEEQLAFDDDTDSDVDDNAPVISSSDYKCALLSRDHSDYAICVTLFT